MMPEFLRHRDLDWSPFTSQQIADVRALRELNQAWNSADRDWAGIPIVQGDASALVVVLEIEYVEAHAYRYYRDGFSESFVLTNDEAQDAFARAQK